VTIDMIRAWKDHDYREALSERERALLPDNPAGAIELTEHELSSVDGGHVPISPTWFSIQFCQKLYSLMFC
jgi:mersacidin/lichenicidin family type 2 lantibiotic